MLVSLGIIEEMKFSGGVFKVGNLHSLDAYGTFLIDQFSKVLLKMASWKTIRRSYECSPLLSLFVCVKNDNSNDRFL